MNPIYKLILIIGSIISLNFYFGIDWRFTLINIVWCIPIAVELFKNKNIIYTKHGLIPIPDKDIIKCEIESPQFHGSQDSFTMLRQTGTFYKKDLKFMTDGIFSGHDVQFKSIIEFQTALIRIL